MPLNEVSRARCEQQLLQWGVALQQIHLERRDYGIDICVYFSPNNAVTCVIDGDQFHDDMIAYLQEQGVELEDGPA